MRDLVEDREAVVEEVVQDVVQQPAGTAREELLAIGVVVIAAREQARHRPQLVIRNGDDVVVADEDVQLGGVQPLDLAVVEREVKDGEEVALILVVVDLRPLALGHDVLDVERMPAEPLCEPLCRLDVRRDDVDPGQPASGELVDDRRRRDDRRAATGARTTDAREARHGYSAGRPSSAPCSRL